MIATVPAVAPPARSNTFRPERQPFRRTSTLRLDSNRVQGPVSFLNPTKARYNQIEPAIPEDEALSTEDVRPRADSVTIPTLTAQSTYFAPPKPTLTYQWTSRNSRKGRQTLLIQEDDLAEGPAPQPTAGPRHIIRIIGRMFTSFPVGDISFDVAILFTIGSAVWVLNGFFTVLPYWNPGAKFPGMVLYGGGITAFIGILIFLLGGYLMLLEAINEDRIDCFG